MTDVTDPADLTALEARRLMARGQLSSVELATACIARVEGLNHAVNAVVAHDFDRLMEGARTADARFAAGKPLGPLHGLPVAIKDMNDVAGLPTTYGSEIHQDNVAVSDDALVGRLVDAGAIPLGKTNNPEWSAGANTRNRVYGTTANPYDVTRNCGGSSGGSAVALACGFAPLASGSDLAGSLRTPAAYCGVVGYRPSAGVVPDPTREIALLPLSTDGPMARTVADCALMLSVMSYPDRDDAFSTVVDGHTLWQAEGFAQLSRCDLSQVRFAFSEDMGFALVAQSTRAAFGKVRDALAPFLPKSSEASPDCTDADSIFSVLRGVSYEAVFGNTIDETPELFGANVHANLAQARSFTRTDIVAGLAGHGAYYRNWQSFFETHDVLITPTVSVGARDWHEMFPTQIDGIPTTSYYHWLALAYGVTLAGHPAITIPCGTDENGLPFGLQLVGKRHGDAALLAVAQELEAIIAGLSGMAPVAPDLDALAKAPPLSDAEGFWLT